MKKLNLCLIGMLLIAMPILQSCDDDGYSLGDFVVRMATVRVISGYDYYLEIDNGETLYPAASDVSWYKPTSGQRVVANYTLLSDNYGGYDHAVKVNFLSNVLTKTVEDLTRENEAEIGNDPVDILENGMWIGGKYLNVDFRFDIPTQYRHRVSLVKNTLVEWPNDGYIHLEYRYNNQDDLSGNWRRSMVSFYLGDYISETAMKEYKGIKVKINSSVNGERELTYDFADPSNEENIENSDEIVDPEGKTE